MPDLIKQLELSELSVVDNPANPMAMAPLFKVDMDPAKEKKVKQYMKEKGCSREDAMKALGYMEKSEMDEIQEKLDAVTKENELLRKALLDNDFVITKKGVEKKVIEEQIEVEGEMVNKSDIPAPVLKALEIAEKQKKIASLEKMAKEKLPNFKREVAMELLKYDWDEAVMEALKAADAAFETAMEEFGKKDAEDMATSESKLEKMVKEVQKDQGLNYYKAYAVVAKTAEGKKLINEMKEDK